MYKNGLCLDHDVTMTTQNKLLKPNEAGKVRKGQAEQELARLHGSRYTEYRRLYQAAGWFEYEPPFPLYVMLEQSYLCNLRCPMCIQGLPAQRQAFEPSTSRMSWELYQRIVLEGERHGCPSIALHVNDEPLLVKDLPERIAFAKAHGFMEIYMTTNGILFTGEKVRQVIEAGVTHILFSVDAATEETYGKIRLGGDYAKVQEAIRMVLCVREARKTALPIIRASFVQNRLNQHETEAFTEKFSHLVDYVEIQGFSSYYGYTDQMIPLGTEPVKDFTCNEPWRKLIVRANGDVLPCCTFYGYEVVLGNVYQTTLFDLFNLPRMKRLRADFAKGIYNESACASCAKSFYAPQVHG